MGVQGWYRILREEGYVPETGNCCSTSLWHPVDDVVMSSIGSHLQAIPKESHLFIDGNGLAFYWHRVAYARYIASVTKRIKNNNNRRKDPSASCVKLKSASLSQAQVRRLLPNFMPLSQLSAVVHEFIKTLREKHRFQVTVYWDGEKRRAYKQATDNKRQERIPEEWNNLQEYCESGIMPPAKTICQWESLFPKSRLFAVQIRHTLAKLQVPSIMCDEEADAAIAKASRGNPNAFVLGLDSDFCFFPDIQYIPFNTFDAAGHVATGVVLRRRELAATLGLVSEDLMTELAILLGNDYVHPADVALDYKGGVHASDILPFLKEKEASYRVTSSSEDVEETLRFVRSLYELKDLDEYPFQDDDSGTDSEDEAGDVILHLVESPARRDYETLNRFAVPKELPLDLCVVNPFEDTSAKDAVVRSLEAYVDKNVDNSMITHEQLEVFRNMPLDNSQAQLVQEGDWRPQWEDIAAAYLIEKLVGSVFKQKALVAQILPPFTIFDQHKFHALMHLASGGEIGPSTGGIDGQRIAKMNGVKTELFKSENSKSSQGKVKPEKEQLPIDEHEERILASIKKNRVTIIQGETGCGKSSRIPVMIMRSPPPDPKLKKLKLYMSQPRRIAAKGLVERVRAVEPDLRDQIALRMGHGVREYETKTTRAWFVTTGYLVRVMANNMESLRDVTHLIIDEVHERSVDTDILCLLCRRFLKTNDHVRLVLMSATLAASLYQEYFGVPEPPLVVGAKRYPVTEVFLEDLVTEMSGYKLPAKVKTTAKSILEECKKMRCRRTPSMSYMEKLFTITANLVATVSETGSSILIFVPGMNEIIGISELIDQMFVPGKHFTCIPVHSDIPFEDQMKVFDEANDNECRVILATNSAESSVTLPALNHVICLGLAKQITYNELSHRQMLEPVWISKASATQRAGRTGRIAPGTVFRLYSRECFECHMSSFEPGEMIRIPLDSVILTLKEMMREDERVTDVLNDCIEPPNTSTIDRSYKSLHQSQFITSPDDDCHMTHLGSFALAMGLDLALCSLIGLGIQFGVGREAISMASILSFPKTPWQIPNPMIQCPNEFNSMTVKTYASKCDFDDGLFSEPLSIMNLLWAYDNVNQAKRKEWCWKNGVSYQRISRLSSTASNVLQRVSQFLGISGESLGLESPPSKMPQAKITLLRIIQTWVFHDTMIECKIKNEVPPDTQVKLLNSSDPIDETILNTVFLKKRHEYSLVDPKEIEHKVWCATSKDLYSDEYLEQTEQRALSYATEKHFSLLWMFVGSTFSVYFSRDVIAHHDWHTIVGSAEIFSSNPEVLIAKESTQGTKRGIQERPSGAWLFTPGNEDETQWFRKYSSPSVASKKKTKALVAQLSSFVSAMSNVNALSIDARESQGPIVLVTRGSHVRDISLQDLQDLTGAAGKIKSKSNKKSGKPVLSFPSTSQIQNHSKRNEMRDSILVNKPEAFRLFSVLASRRRSHHIEFELEVDDEVEEVSESDINVSIYPDPKETKLTFRWSRFNSDCRVFVDESSPVASAIPIGWSGSMYCCAANALETKGGALKAEGLTLLPLNNLFFLLSRILFGLVSGNPDDEEFLRSGFLWVSKENARMEPEDIMRRLRDAALFHRTYNAGEQLVCLPKNVEAILKLFDGIEGCRTELWESFPKDPFMR